jgi:hypothetical protein
MRLKGPLAFAVRIQSDVIPVYLIRFKSGHALVNARQTVKRSKLEELSVAGIATFRAVVAFSRL